MKTLPKSAIRLFAQVFPYALKLLDDGSCIPLNRYYKPLGLDADIGWVDYSDWARHALTPHAWNEAACMLSYKLRPETSDLIYLYDGNTIPCNSNAGKLFAKNWERYLRKLAILQTILRFARAPLPPATRLTYQWLLQRAAQMDTIQRAMSSLGCDYDGAACPDANLWRLFESVATV